MKYREFIGRVTLFEFHHSLVYSRLPPDAQNIYFEIGDILSTYHF